MGMGAERTGSPINGGKLYWGQEESYQIWPLSLPNIMGGSHSSVHALQDGGYAVSRGNVVSGEVVGEDR
eukprot:CAMPEP_0194328222 /NCGR_PEP_ID=MMETSP0171-20130528/43913_1 /TAXON_ID=218684 /ORGANISM="Corethron pennatum, Strain L29A3" /LENGTH=68 /DNA_ID=CAMNT_0039088471 /DNA_START=234 /DNA_END=440 /DNA_ORIENTATION=-